MYQRAFWLICGAVRHTHTEAHMHDRIGGHRGPQSLTDCSNELASSLKPGIGRSLRVQSVQRWQALVPCSICSIRSREEAGMILGYEASGMVASSMIMFGIPSTTS
jgi:hypothetical protein